jgi:hypothetical protein
MVAAMLGLGVAKLDEFKLRARRWLIPAELTRDG